MHPLGACAEVLCSTVRSGRRVVEERPEGIQSGRLADWLALWEELRLSQCRKMKNWSWAWRRSCWRSLSICAGRWGKSFSGLLIQTSCLAGPANSPAPRHAAAESIQASRDPSCGGHHWRGHRAGGGQHDRQSLQQRHSEFRASRPSIDLHFQTSSSFSLKTSEEEPMCFWLPPGFHLPPVPSEDGGHQDVLPERWLSGDPGTVLRTLSEEQIRGGREEGANWSGEMTETNTAHMDFPLSVHLNSHY